jgi:hypothetical protein
MTRSGCTLRLAVLAATLVLDPGCWRPGLSIQTDAVDGGPVSPAIDLASDGQTDLATELCVDIYAVCPFGFEDYFNERCNDDGGQPGRWCKRDGR